MKGLEGWRNPAEGMHDRDTLHGSEVRFQGDHRATAKLVPLSQSHTRAPSTQALLSLPGDVKAA